MEHMRLTGDFRNNTVDSETNTVSKYCSTDLVSLVEKKVSLMGSMHPYGVRKAQVELFKGKVRTQRGEPFS